MSQAVNRVPVNLSELLKEDAGLPADLVVTSFQTEPDLIETGELFVCLALDSDAAAEQLETAKARGARAALADGSLSVPESLSENLYRVENVQSVPGRLAQALYGFPANQMKSIAITGTSGKTSVSYIIAGMLAASGYPVGLIGSLGVYDGRVLLPCREATPRPLVMAELMARMIRNGCTHVIVEVSSEALEQSRLAGIRFDAVCLTNIRRDHLDLHKTVDIYRRTKMKIFDYVKEDALVVCNPSDRVTGAVLHMIKNPTITIGLHPNEAMVNGMRVEQNRGEQTFYIIAGSDAIPVRTKIIGKEHICNCLTAAALGLSWDIDLKTVVRGIERVEHIPGRMERIDCGQPFGVFVDNASTPESLADVLRTLREVTEGMIYTVLSAPEDNDRSKRPLMGRAAELGSDLVILTIGRQADPATGVKDLLQGIENSAKCLKRTFRRSDAITWALSNAAPEDTVLIVGSDPAPDVDPEEIVSDRQFVRHWLYENQPCLEAFWY
ncbi:MAG: UDP-N-acetylmuramyl-tripeptide synthetase [Thermoguttaceae bacterium]|nr:UDP-N-acetylmuramyl-tripeptide synthetase [Thermoguttaceae bacterium]